MQPRTHSGLASTRPRQVTTVFETKLDGIWEQLYLRNQGERDDVERPSTELKRESEEVVQAVVLVVLQSRDW